MKNTNTKSRKMLVKLVDGQGNIYSKIFAIELPKEFETQGFKVERLEIAKEFVKPYPGALAKLASNLVSSQTSELDKIRILADSTLDSTIKVRFASDYNAATAKRVNAFNNLHPKVRAYRAEKGLRDVTLESFLLDFAPIDADKQKYNPFQYITLSSDQKGFSLKAVDLIDQSSEAIDK